MEDTQESNLFEVDAAFQQQKIATATDDELQRYLLNLCSRRNLNQTIYVRDVVRGITLNSLLTMRFMSRLDRRSRGLHSRVMVLTVVATVAGVIQAIIGIVQLCNM